MSTSEELKSIFESISAGKRLSDSEIAVFQHARQEGQITLARGDRAVAAGGSISDSVVITGDGNTYTVHQGLDKETFRQITRELIDEIQPLRSSGDYERLRDAYIEPWSVFKRVDLDRFIGREWLLAEVDAFLNENDRGYFVLEAEAGLGKTTFLAWLVKQRSYIHHFAELAPGQEVVDFGLKNLGAQLVLEYHLKTLEMSPGAVMRPDYLERLLKLAAAQRPEGSTVVLVVDALDEAGTPEGQNVLGLPQVLPEGVYVIASQRPVAVALQVDTASTPRRVFRLKAGSAENQADMRRYLEGAAEWPGIANALKGSGDSTEKFIMTLMEKCRGMWIYLHYVIHEIEKGDRSSLDLDALPEGVTKYYASYWQQWRDKDEEAWYEVYLPLLATLAAARETVGIERLVAWTGVTLALPRLRRRLNEQWRPFLTVSEVDGETHYRFYHKTLTEFFDGQVDRAKLFAAESAMVDELAEATRAAHGRLADRYLTAWSGLAEELPGLRDEKIWDMDDGYGLRHLAKHLIEASQSDSLHKLLKSRYSLIKSSKSFDGMISDLRLGIEAVRSGGPAQMPELFHHQMILAGLHTIASSLPREFLTALPFLGLDTEAAMLAELIPNPWRRAEMRAAVFDVIFKVTGENKDENLLVAEIEIQASGLIREGRLNQASNRSVARLIVSLGLRNQESAIAMVPKILNDPYYQALAYEGIAATAKPDVARSLLQKGYSCLIAADLSYFALGRYEAIGRMAAECDPILAKQALIKAWTIIEERIAVGFISVQDQVDILEDMYNLNSELADQMANEVWRLIEHQENPVKKAEFCKILFGGVRNRQPDVAEKTLKTLHACVRSIRAEIATISEEDEAIQVYMQRQLAHDLARARKDLAIALALEDVDKAVEIATNIEDVVNRDYALQEIAKLTAKEELEHAFSIYLQAEGQIKPREIADLVKINLSQPSPLSKRTRIAAIVDTINRVFESKISNHALAFLLQEITIKERNLAQMLAPTILESMEWIASPFDPHTPLAYVVDQWNVLGQWREFHEEYQRRLNGRCSQTSAEQDELNSLRCEIVRAADDDRLEKAIWKLRRLSIKYDLDDNWIQQSLVSIVAKIVDLTSKHRERLIEQVGETHWGINDRDWLYCFLMGLLESLQRPDRQEEFYHSSAERAVILQLSWVLFSNSDEWWKVTFEILDQQGRLGSQHLLTALMALWPAVEQISDPDALKKLEEAHKRVNTFFSEFPQYFFA